jgi:hypothetical protein
MSRLRSRAAFAAAVIAGGILGTPLPAHAVDCTSIAPDAVAATNRANIQGCLNTGSALLQGATYTIDAGLSIPSGSNLAAASSSAIPTLQMVGTANSVAQMVAINGPSAQMSFVRLNGNGVIGTSGVSAIVVMHSGDSNFVHDVNLYGANTSTGLYFSCTTCTGSTVLRAQIHDNKYGVIFKNTLSTAKQLVQNSNVYNSDCDGYTFAGYGEVDGGSSYHNGTGCANNLNAAGMYSIGNEQGAKVTNVNVYENCGVNIDIVNGGNFSFDNLTVDKPGYPVTGATVGCFAQSSMQLTGVHDSSVTNSFVKNNLATNRVDNGTDPGHLFQATGAAAFSDLPQGGNTIIAFSNGKNPQTGYYSYSNTFDSNQFIAYYTGGGAYGYFASRDTGWDATGAWKPSFYKGNSPIGGTGGSRRGGGNWYAASSTCTSSTSPYPCNTDDYQHPTTNWRNDSGLAHY